MEKKHLLFTILSVVDSLPSGTAILNGTLRDFVGSVPSMARRFRDILGFVTDITIQIQDGVDNILFAYEMPYCALLCATLPTPGENGWQSISTFGSQC